MDTDAPKQVGTMSLLVAQVNPNTQKERVFFQLIQVTMEEEIQDDGNNLNPRQKFIKFYFVEIDFEDLEPNKTFVVLEKDHTYLHCGVFFKALALPVTNSGVPHIEAECINLPIRLSYLASMVAPPMPSVVTIEETI